MEAEGAGIVAATEFSVEDFVPQRLEVDLEIDDETPMGAGEVRTASISSRYLYGAPASDLPVESEARLRVDPSPFPQLKGYRFGAVDARFNERFITLAPATTDAQGNATTEINIEDVKDTSGAPLRADIVVGVVEPGGRVVRESARVPVRPNDRYLGLRLADEKQVSAKTKKLKLKRCSSIAMARK